MNRPAQQWPHELDKEARVIPGDRDSYMAQMLGALQQIQANTRRTTFAVTLGFVFIAILIVLMALAIASG